jgi:hypothetical protein
VRCENNGARVERQPPLPPGWLRGLGKLKVPLDAREAHVVLFTGIELLIDAPVKLGDLALDGGNAAVHSRHLIAQDIETAAHIGTQVIHALHNETCQLFNRVDCFLRTADGHREE